MATTPAVSPKRLMAKLGVIEGLVNDHAGWSPSGNYGEQASRLLRALAELEAMQEPFRVVDADLPFAVRAARLQGWLQTHPDYQNAGLTLVDDLPAAKGGRGLRATAPLTTEQEALMVPVDCHLSTETASCSVELGPLTDEPRLQLAAMPHLLLALHLMCENAKALAAPPVDPTAPVPPVVSRAQQAAARAAWETATYGAPLPAPHDEDACDDDGHGHSHAGGGGHGHSHGGGGGGSHGHSHGPGGNCTGHHGAAEDEEDVKPLRRTELHAGGHPWGSQWRAYISLLPSPGDMRTCLYWGDAEMAALQGTYAHYTCASFLRDIAKNYLSLLHAFGAPPDGSNAPRLIQGLERHYTWAAFRWAMSVMMSRQNQGACVGAGGQAGWRGGGRCAGGCGASRARLSLRPVGLDAANTPHLTSPATTHPPRHPPHPHLRSGGWPGDRDVRPRGAHAGLL